MIQETSRAAHQSVIDELGPRQEIVFHQLQVSGGCTNEKLSDLLSLPINQITPRILELREKGLVKKMYEEPGKSGRMAIVWGVVHA
tara:strand:- start:2863 stop:3120 length:258 start_codon:yes stop_codon:yes gene_type:complete